MPRMSSREIVFKHLARQAKQFPDLDHRPLEVGGLSPRDAALAQAIDHAAIRHWLTLSAVLDAKLSQPWDQLERTVQAALLGGAAQLLYLDKVPEHAAINESVEWIKANGRQRAGGLVNAVLRRVAELRESLIEIEPDSNVLGDDPAILPRSDGSAWRLREAVFDADPLRMLAQQTSNPHSLLEHWMRSFDGATMRHLAVHGLVQPPVLVTGLRKADVEGSNVPLVPHDEPGFYVFGGDHKQLEELLRASPAARVQDPTAAMAVDLSHALHPSPRMIVDLCAGKGTKTRQLQHLHPDAAIIATDRDSARLAVLRESFADDPQVTVVDFQSVYTFREKAELLLLDVPCSNSGVFARRVEAKYRFGRASLESLVGVQRQIMADSIPLLAPHACILYATCSIETAENQRQAEWLQRWHGMERIDESARLPQGMPGEAPRVYSDGGCGVLLRAVR